MKFVYKIIHISYQHKTNYCHYIELARMYLYWNRQSHNWYLILFSTFTNLKKINFICCINLGVGVMTNCFFMEVMCVHSVQTFNYLPFCFFIMLVIGFVTYIHLTFIGHLWKYLLNVLEKNPQQIFNFRYFSVICSIIKY